MRLVFTFIGLVLFSLPYLTQQVPEGFTIEPIVEDLEDVAGIRFINDSVSLVWTFDGRVFSRLATDGALSNSVDISDEVGYWGDLGMLGFAVDPDFDINGHIYLLYPVDNYHLFHADSADYDPTVSAHYAASLGRVTRYQLDTDYPHALVPDSRSVLLGDSLHNGIPLMSASHGVGSLIFGSDGSLLISCGDGSTWAYGFNGGEPYPEFAYEAFGLEHGMIRPDEDLGPFRAQYLDTYNGKVLRIDPQTGLGIASNPFYSASKPDAPRSKVWSMGLRNPFRITRKPGTGSTIMSSGDPGTLFIGDVGYYTWEEINVADGPAMNFGWPIYEGPYLSEANNNQVTYHPLYTNPLAGDCEWSHYQFRDLIAQPSPNHISVWNNPCNETIGIEDSVITFVHELPIVAYANQAVEQEFPTQVPGFNTQGEAVGIPFQTLDSIADDDPGITGISSVGGDFYYGTSFPEEYFGAYFQSDYSGWFKAFWFDESNQLTNYQDISSELGPILTTTFNPYDECLYLTSGFPQGIVRMCYGGNVAPNAVISSDIDYGPSPITVIFDASQSNDADGDPLSYAWDFGDGAGSNEISPVHEFIAPDDMPIAYQVSLMVTDTAGNSDIAHKLISLNNTPPVVDISTFEDGDLYAMDQTTITELSAYVQDQEHAANELDYAWQVVIHHNTHEHPDPIIHEVNPTVNLEPVGCEAFSTYYFSISLEVTDAAGLKGSDLVRLYPDCDNQLQRSYDYTEWIAFPNPNSGDFHVRGDIIEDESYRLQVFDPVGHLIYDEEKIGTEFSQFSIKLGQLSTGMYHVRVSSAQDQAIIPISIIN